MAKDSQSTMRFLMRWHSISCLPCDFDFRLKHTVRCGKLLLMSNLLLSGKCILSYGTCKQKIF